MKEAIRIVRGTNPAIKVLVVVQISACEYKAIMVATRGADAHIAQDILLGFDFPFIVSTTYAKEPTNEIKTDAITNTCAKIINYKLNLTTLLLTRQIVISIMFATLVTPRYVSVKKLYSFIDNIINKPQKKYTVQEVTLSVQGSWNVFLKLGKYPKQSAIVTKTTASKGLCI